MSRNNLYRSEAFEALNAALRKAYNQIAPDTKVYLQTPDIASGLTIPCWRTYWLDFGRADGTDVVAMVQIDIFQDGISSVGPDIKEALRKTDALDKILGLSPDPNTSGIVEIYGPNKVVLSEMRLTTWEQGWVTVPDKPGILHLARTIVPKWFSGNSLVTGG